MGKTQALLSSSLMAGPGESGPASWCCTRGGFGPKDAERQEGAPRWWGGAAPLVGRGPPLLTGGLRS